MHGILLSPETIDSIVSQLLDRLKMFIDKLIQFSQPHMREWSSERRRNRKNGSKMAQIDTQNSAIGIGTDRGFIQSDWALIFMLRMGLMAVQMMGQAGKSLANIGNPKIVCHSINLPQFWSPTVFVVFWTKRHCREFSANFASIQFPVHFCKCQLAHCVARCLAMLDSRNYSILLPQPLLAHFSLKMIWTGQKDRMDSIPFKGPF